ncbi:MAG: 4Fe-4S binding protein [Nitrososphaerota archaeon]
MSSRSKGPSPRAGWGGEVSLAKRLIKINLLITAIVIAAYIALNLSGIARGAYCSLSAGGVTFLCPLGFLQRPELAGASSCAIIIGVAAILMAILLLGRFFCGWICPMSIVLRLLGSKGAGGNGRLYIPAFSVSLALILLASWIMGFPVFCIICPIGIVSRLIISALSGILDIWGILWGAAIFTATITLIKARAWCNGLCPLGALQTLLSPLKLTRIKASHGCKKCDACVEACPLKLEIHEDRRADQMSCTTCLECVKACPFNALKLVVIRPLSSSKSGAKKE